MKKYTITDKEWESVLNKVQTLEKENEKLKGVIEAMTGEGGDFTKEADRNLLFFDRILKANGYKRK